MSDDLSIPSPTYRVPRHRRRHGSGHPAAGADRRRPGRRAAGGGRRLVAASAIAAPRCRWCRRTAGPIRVKPENPGGMQVAGADEDILSGGAEAAGRQAGARRRRPRRRRRLRRQPPPAPSLPRRRRRLPAPAAAPAPAAGQPRRPTPAADRRSPAKPPPRRTKRAGRPPPRPAASALVQLAAVRSEDAAKSEWQRLSKRMPDLLGQRTAGDQQGRARWPHVLAPAHRRVHRRRRRPTAFCERVRAKGAGCSVAEF